MEKERKGGTRKEKGTTENTPPRNKILVTALQPQRDVFRFRTQLSLHCNDWVATRLKLEEQYLRLLYPVGWITVIRCSIMVCRTLTSCSSCRRWSTPLHDWSLVRDAVIISRRYYATFIGYPSDSVSSSKWHVWFVSRCPRRRLSTCLGKWLLPRVRQHSALSAVSWRSDLRDAANTQQLRRQNFCSRCTSLVELFRSSCTIQTSPTDCSDDS